MLYTIFDVMVIAFLYYKYMVPYLKTQSYPTKALIVVFSVYLLGVFVVTLSPVITSLPFILIPRFSRTVNVVPFIDLIEHTDGALTQVIFNIVLTVPFGYLLPLLLKPKRYQLTQIFLATLVLTCSIESIQWLLANDRVADITDIMTNTIGGMIGFITYKATKQLFFKTR